MEEIKESILLFYSVPAYAVLILTEITFSHISHRSVYTFRNTLENICLCILNSGIDLLMRGVVLVVFVYFFQHRIFRIEGVLLYWITLVIGLDFLFYLLHLIDHKCRLFWAVHVTHHSSEEFNLTVGFRSSVFQPVYRFLYFIPLPLMGFNPADILTVYSASQIYGILLHTKSIGKLGWLEWILATPSHHRVHHGSNPEYLDKNMGMLLIVWDRLFGTFQEEKEPVRFGITKPIKDRTPARIVLHEWVELFRDLRKVRTVKGVIRVLFSPP